MKTSRAVVIILVVLFLSASVFEWSTKKGGILNTSPIPADSAATMSTQVTFPHGGEQLIEGNSYMLTWLGGPDPTHIFLIDTSLKSVGESASIVDRIYDIKNNGIYNYTVPTNLKPGVYEFQIGNNTSNIFQIAAN